MKNTHLPKTIIGTDPGDIRNAIGVLTPDGTIIEVGGSSPSELRLRTG